MMIMMMMKATGSLTSLAQQTCSGWMVMKEQTCYAQTMDSIKKLSTSRCLPSLGDQSDGNESKELCVTYLYEEKLFKVNCWRTEACKLCYETDSSLSNVELICFL